jgi:DNA-directed RNA polymerase specialized sigma24 family protein
MSHDEQLFHANLKTIYWWLHRLGFHPRKPGYDEAEQVALIAGWRACKDHDPAKGKVITAIRTYVTQALFNHRRDGWRSRVLCGVTQSPWFNSTVERADIIDWLPDHRPQDDTEAAEEREEREAKLAIIRNAARKLRAVSPMHQSAIDLIAAGLENHEIEGRIGAASSTVKAYRTRFCRDVKRILALDARAEQSRNQQMEQSA